MGKKITRSIMVVGIVNILMALLAAGSVNLEYYRYLHNHEYREKLLTATSQRIVEEAKERTGHRMPRRAVNRNKLNAYLHHHLAKRRREVSLWSSVLFLIGLGILFGSNLARILGIIFGIVSLVIAFKYLGIDHNYGLASFSLIWGLTNILGLQKKRDESEALFNGAKKGNLKLVESLLKKGEDVNAKDKDGCTPIHYASLGGHVEVVKILFQQGSQMEIKDIYGATPLHYASSNGQVEIVKMLFQRGADMETKNNNEATPLHLASLKSNVEMVTLLLQYGANMEAKDKNGMTPLFQASHKGQVGIAKALLQKGSNVQVKDQHGLTPLHYAKTEEMGALLRSCEREEGEKGEKGEKIESDPPPLE